MQPDDLPGPAALSDMGVQSALEGRSDSADQWARDVFICVLVAVAEGLLVLIGMSGTLSLPGLMLAHCAIMLGVTLVLDQRERQHADSRVLAVAVVTTAVSGPLGAGFTAILGVYLHYRKLETELLAKWYDRISGHAHADDVVELHERIQAGRTLNPYVDARARFAAILRSGPLDEKQRVLSIITQKYHPGFARLLELALRNQDPPIRVQAAAVMARLKEQERGRLKTLLAQLSADAGLSIDADVNIVREIVATINSGLLDEQDAAVARDTARELLSGARQRLPEHTEAALLLADLLARQHEDAAAAEILRPILDRGVADAAQPLKAALIRLRRFSEAAAIAAPIVTSTHDVSTRALDAPRPAGVLFGDAA